jgi:tetratricopeptide (TPR) repeat protein
MFAKIISGWRGALWLGALAALLAGCTPAGPRAFLKGKNSLDHGDYPAAAAQFKTAATLLATNASAWNYYGVALQHVGLPDEAATAYARALECNRDLVEAHFNLGCLWLDQNKPDAAKTEFTAYTLRRNNDPVGWLKLGSAQLRTGEIVPAERSFSTVLALKPGDPDAYNGLGLARMQRNKPREAAQFFAAAIASRPDFAPAILNLATTSQQYLRDNKTALENYRAYLALNPRPANWDDVNAIASGLEQAMAPAPAPVVATVVAPVAKPVAPAPVSVRPTRPVATEPVAESRPQPKPVQTYASRPPVTTKPVTVRTANPTPPPAPPTATVPTQVVKVPPEPWIVAPPKPPDTTSVAASTSPAPVTPESIEVPMPEPEQKPGLWHRLFGGNKSDATAPSGDSGTTPLPPNPEPAPAKTFYPEPAPVTYTRYQYLSPAPPAPGARLPASGAFTKARLYEQDEKWIEALEWYQQAADMDPSWFEAQYNTGVLAYRLRNYSVALPSYEYALAIQPDSADARYNFALALKAAGHAPDAADELKKILAANPDEVRAHLALANLYAQQLHDASQARAHYLKVLELDPANAQASDIRFWLSANP